MQKLNRFLVLALLLAWTAGCGELPMKPTMPDRIKSLVVPAFENKTTQPGLENELTQRVVQSFIVDGRLGVASKESAQALLKGSIQRYDRLVLTRDANQVPQQYKLQVQVDLDFYELKEGKEELLWSTKATVDTVETKDAFDSTNTRSLREFTNYYVINVAGIPPEDEHTALDRLLSQMARRIVRRSLDGR